MIVTWNELAIGWAQYYGAAVLQNTVFLTLVLVALRLLRGAPARTRHAIALVGLVKLLLPPFLALPRSGGTLAGSGATDGGFAPLIFGGAAPTGAATSALPEWPGLLALLLLVWAVGATFWLATAALCTWRLSRRLKSSEPLPADQLPCALPPGVSVRRSARISIPLTLGPWPRRIYVPPAWDDWTPACRTLALRHELEHLDRRDGLWQGLQLLARGLYFYHPLVWLLDRELDATREMAVDDATAGAGRTAGATYSRLLMNMADSLVCGSETCSSAAALFRRRRELMNRIYYQLAKGETMKTWTAKTILVTVALLALAVPLSWHVNAAETEVVASGAPTEDDARQIDAAKQADKAAKAEKTEQAEKAEQAEKTKMTAKVSSDPIEIKIVIRGDDKVDLKGHTMSVADFDRKLSGSGLLARDDVVYTIVCADDVTMGDVHLVSAVLRQAVAKPKVRFMNAEHEALPVVLPSIHIEEKLASFDEQDLATVEVAADGVVTYDGKKLPVTKLGKVAAKETAQNPKLVVALSSEMKTDYLDFAAARDERKKAGITRIAILPPKGAPKISFATATP